MGLLQLARVINFMIYPTIGIVTHSKHISDHDSMVINRL